MMYPYRMRHTGKHKQLYLVLRKDISYLVHNKRRE